MCTVLLPPGDNTIAVNKYINNLRVSIFWDVSQRQWVVCYRNFGTACR